MQFRLTHLSGGHANQIDVVGGTPILLGRDDVCHVRIHREKDLVVSSQHAQIDEAEGGGFQIANLSRNGTLVNGAVVEESAPLPNHATIQLGRDGPRIRFDVDEETQGISFAEVKRKTGKITRGNERPPDTEERPIIALQELASKRASSPGDTKNIVMIAIMVLVVTAALLFVLFRK